jgi:hypothetical protein
MNDSYYAGSNRLYPAGYSISKVMQEAIAIEFSVIAKAVNLLRTERNKGFRGSGSSGAQI